MPIWLAIIVGAALVGLSVYGASGHDRYAIAAIAGSNPPTAWRLDRVTGGAEVCYFDSKRQVACASHFGASSAPGP